ncbi:MAG: hypothetical protein MUC97_11970 [Bernardetiaceae bacterium]|jgi:hypothetical protein|nr:hypothetical protein [Bernardetiaceae bacterium]
MKNVLKTATLIASLLFTVGGFTACGGGDKPEEAQIEESEKVDGPLDALGKLGDVAKAIEGASKQSEELKKQRIERGDTVPMHYEKLAEWLPASISGYEKQGDPEGSTSTMSGFGVSEVKQAYVNGDQRVDVKIMDYNSMNGAGGLALLGFSAAAEMSIDNSTEKQVGFKQGETIKGSQVFHKKDKHATISAVVTDRFVIEVSANQQEDMELVKKIFQDMPLNKMAEL